MQTMTKKAQIEAEIEGYGYYHGNTPGPYLVVRSAFHGGGIVSRHRSLKAAARAVVEERNAECCCGCAGIVPASREDEIPSRNGTCTDYTSLVA